MAAWKHRTPSGRALEEENRKLKKLLAEAHLDMAALKDIASGKF